MGDVMTNIEIIQSKIYTVRGIRVMLDRDLAVLYEVATGNLNKSVKRNIENFPDGFMFQLTGTEYDALRFQIGSLKRGEHSKYLPYVFTEYGVSMLSSVLKSKMATQINIKIIRAFVEMRRMAAMHPEYELLREKIKRLEAEIRENKMTQLVDSKIFEGKLIQLSQGLQNSNAKIDGFSAVVELFSSELDEFGKSHIIIKKPEDGLGTNSNN